MAPGSRLSSDTKLHRGKEQDLSIQTTLSIHYHSFPMSPRLPQSLTVSLILEQSEAKLEAIHSSLDLAAHSHSPQLDLANNPLSPILPIKESFLTTQTRTLLTLVSALLPTKPIELPLLSENPILLVLPPPCPSLHPSSPLGSIPTSFDNNAKNNFQKDPCLLEKVVNLQMSSSCPHLSLDNNSYHRRNLGKKDHREKIVRKRKKRRNWRKRNLKDQQERCMGEV